MIRGLSIGLDRKEWMKEAHISTERKRERERGGGREREREGERKKEGERKREGEREGVERGRKDSLFLSDFLSPYFNITKCINTFRLNLKKINTFINNVPCISNKNMQSNYFVEIWVHAVQR